MKGSLPVAFFVMAASSVVVLQKCDLHVVSLFDWEQAWQGAGLAASVFAEPGCHGALSNGVQDCTRVKSSLLLYACLQDLP